MSLITLQQGSAALSPAPHVPVIFVDALLSSSGGPDEVPCGRYVRETGLAGRVTRRLHDIATAPDEVPEADVVVLHRVVCCYPDYERLLGAASSTPC